MKGTNHTTSEQPSSNEGRQKMFYINQEEYVYRNKQEGTEQCNFHE